MNILVDIENVSWGWSFTELLFRLKSLHEKLNCSYMYNIVLRD